ncbi:stalk domain-containing protein [Lederbergia citrea]|uniref:stalk domain-containing protein n=1 Tax=Lederbergia citrea TaxID=2833581 RepID=UPI001BCA486D|nr:stalk domain-containing protein [Lederbergia citrea]MBS4177237.1 hypothetical protein [Lederbergia citrea]
MKKTSFFLFIFLLCLTSSLLFYQWKGYSSQTEDSFQNTKQKVSISQVANAFRVEQTISDIPAGKYAISLPKKAKEITCYFADDQVCDLKEAKRFTLNIEEGKVHFTYLLPAQSNLKSILLRNWTVHIEDLPIVSTRVQLSDSRWRKGSWVSDGNLLGMKKMALLDYYVFEKTGDAPVLFWQQEALNKTKVNDRLTVFANADVDKAINLIDVKKNKGKNYSVVITSLHEEVDEDTFMLVNSKNKLNTIYEKIAITEIENSLIFPDREKWLIGIISSAIFKKPVGEQKAKNMYLELTNKLSAAQLDDWLNKIILSQEEPLESIKMDEVLEETTGFKSHFFALNADIGTPLEPFLLVDPRYVYVDGIKTEEALIVHEDGKSFLALEPLLKSLQYKTQVISNQNGLKAEKGLIKYRFYPNKRIFELNGQQYGMQQAPIVRIGKDLYIDIIFINILLNAQVIDDENEIKINQ